MQGILFRDDTASQDNLLALNPSQLGQDDAQKLLNPLLSVCDDGELFLEFVQSERLVFSEGKVKTSGNNLRRGMGLRAIQGESCYFAHSSDLSLPSLSNLIERLSIQNGSTKTCAATPIHEASEALYTIRDPLSGITFQHKLDVLQQIDAKAREHPLLQEVMINLQAEWQWIAGIRTRQDTYQDVRPRCELSINVILRKGDQRASGHHGIGGREDYTRLLSEWPDVLDKALAQAERMLDAKDGVAGGMDVLLGAGWPGILLHEAVGHGLEGDFNRKGTSVFSTLLGRRVASSGVTVIDQGNIAARRGSLNIDDEGTPTQATTLIEDGILCGYMQDRLNARLMRHAPTGNGRRQSYAHLPMPRMTNTYMKSGDSSSEEMLGEIKQGLYAVSFGGGSVDITSGQFVFNCTEAYEIENGKIGAPVKGATLIGMGAEALKGIHMIGNDLKMDTGMGMCGKEGQWVPVGVGQPSLLIKGLNVGGSKNA